MATRLVNVRVRVWDRSDYRLELLTFQPGWRTNMATLDNTMAQRLASNNKGHNINSLSSELLCPHAARRTTKKRLTKHSPNGPLTHQLLWANHCMTFLSHRKDLSSCIQKEPRHHSQEEHTHTLYLYLLSILHKIFEMTEFNKDVSLKQMFQTKIRTQSDYDHCVYSKDIPKKQTNQKINLAKRIQPVLQALLMSRTSGRWGKLG